ncbi:amino acid transporter [Microbacterium betulae]|uniref:Amino acid transporter n=2 Tax=Microbacterium betulae TaxID=2981139 RepID=A0AA97FKH3_9MICO|nr:amino acid transporter [Microbacterium sp. AB]WOF24730.1 amino acid transporter [Microbacterium sp. AB]
MSAPGRSRHANTPDGRGGASWWRVMCLTGVDYFSTLGYQPAIAALAAGVLSPIATLVLVLVTLFGALPVYRQVAKESPHGEGSIAMLERLLPWWGGKLLVLVLLGFAATDFMITITLSAADATAHIVENPFVPAWLDGMEVPLTLFLVALLGAVFLKGFRGAISIAVVLVGAFLALNAVVLVAAFADVVAHPVVVDDWLGALTAAHGDPVAAIAIALLVFPRLALGLSGFETGVAVMPQIRGAAGDTEERPTGRIRGARRLLTAAALTMSVFLLGSGLVTTLLIPQEEFLPGGAANGRALAYLAHALLGEGFGTLYDTATVLILWFAGASAMAGLLNLVPRYLPRYGMAPRWASATRPLVIVFTAIAFLITIVFEADVDAQSGAYATGVLVLITSASIAVALSARRRHRPGAAIGFAVIAAVFLATTIVNVVERPDGVRIAGLFILGIVTVSLLSRVPRSFQLRARSVTFDERALSFIRHDAERHRAVRVVAKEPGSGTATEFAEKLRNERRFNGIPSTAHVIFLQVHIGDSSDFEEDLVVVGEEHDGYRIVHVRGGSVPNAIAAVLLAIRDETGVVPDVYFEWNEGNPASNMLRFLVFGTGEIAPVTREVLRRAEPRRGLRPDVHVG